MALMQAKNPPQPPGGQSDDAAAPVQDPAQSERIAALEKELSDLKQQLSKLTDVAARAQADLQNAKVRMQKDGEDIRKYASESVIRKLLPIVDNFQRAFSHLPEDLSQNDWIKGVQAIEQDLLRHLSEMGLKKMDVLGHPVDTARHEVLIMGEGEEGKILQVFEDGYELHGKIIRPAKVKVGSGSLEEEAKK